MKKPCANCGKRIPRAAPMCIFCGQAHPQSGPPPPWQDGEQEARRMMPALLMISPVVEAAAAPVAGAAAAPVAVATPVTAPESKSPAMEPQVEPELRGPVLEAEPASEEEEPPLPQPRLQPQLPSVAIMAPPVPFQSRLRFLQAVAGAVLLVLFCLPWQGARSWDLLRYLQGTDFVRQLSLLCFGAVLVSTGILPVPPAFRAALGAALGVAFLSLGGVMLTVWQQLLGVLVCVLLPASLLVRTHSRRARLPRLLGLMAVLALLSLYIVPRDDVAPIRVAVDLVYYQKDESARFIGTYLLLPLPLVSLATVALLGADVAVIGELLSWLLLCWGPGALLVLAIDNTQAYMAAAVLACAACAAYGVAEMLRRITRTVEPER